ncbi:MAG: hypothetical protein JHC69_12260 [Akkermansiaceae bacterium]|nr:hypothetical protein [Akkermansiaceae bacterium]
MKTMTKPVVRIGEPVNCTFQPVLEIDAHALLWASAKGRDFIPASATIGRKIYQNGPLRREPLPDARMYPVLQERLGAQLSASHAQRGGYRSIVCHRVLTHGAAGRGMELCSMGGNHKRQK